MSAQYARVPLHDDEVAMVVLSDREATVTMAPPPTAPTAAAVSSSADGSVVVDVNDTSSKEGGEATGGSTSDINGDYVLTLLSIVGEQQRQVRANPDWTVLFFKHQAYPEEMKAQKNVRFIHKGGMLEDSKTLAQAGVETEAFIHVAISDYKPPVTPAAEAAHPMAIDRDDWPVDAAGEPRPLAGMQLQLPMFGRMGAGGAARPPEGTNHDFIFGFCMAVFFGLFALLWAWGPYAPRKRKLGVFLGLGVYFIYRFFIDSPASATNNGLTDPNANGTGPGASFSSGGTTFAFGDGAAHAGVSSTKHLVTHASHAAASAVPTLPLVDAEAARIAARSSSLQL
jgi:hypothetical protein